MSRERSRLGVRDWGVRVFGVPYRLIFELFLDGIQGPNPDTHLQEI